MNFVFLSPNFPKTYFNFTDRLKKNGFKWAPTAKAWQRPLDFKSMAAAERIDFIKPLDGRRISDLQPKQQKRNAPER